MSNIDAYTKKRDQSIASLKETFGTLRAGRVSAALLDNVKVDLYGEGLRLNTEQLFPFFLRLICRFVRSMSLL